MVKIDLTPTYRGLWIFENDFGFFNMWEKENGFGKIWEEYHRRLIEANVERLVKIEDKEISFIKRYANQPADLLKEKIFYSGRGNGNGFYDGEWGGKNDDGKIISGDFYLVDAKEKWAVEELQKVIGGLHIKSIDHRVKDLQRQFPYTPII